MLWITGTNPAVSLPELDRIRPFHYGYCDTPGGHRPAGDGPGRAANEGTITDWDPVSKQPLFKTCAARVTLVARGAPTARDRTGTPVGGTR